ncbi:hypothetical protein IM40_01775 [Candidatus Paracaedimonas acanthamoebae]|nr:hypothetical protein IM40_01775 [Candidatus Paracaedimonas acanthamoebae]
MKMFLHFVILVLSFICASGFKGHASAFRPAIIEERDDEGYFKMFREKPEEFTGSALKAFLKRIMDLYPTVIAYDKKGQNFTDTIYKRFFKAGDYYFTFLTRHNLINETFFNLENVTVEFIASSSSGLQTKLHYNILLGDNAVPFSFRILYVSEFNKKIASTPLIHTYQKSRTIELAKKVIYHNSTVSGDWNNAVKKQAQIEKKRAETSKEKSEEAKKAIEGYFRGLSDSTTPLSSSESQVSASSSASPIEGRPSMVRKFSTHDWPRPIAKSPPKKVVFHTAPQAKEGIEQQYILPNLPNSKTLQRKPSRAILEEKKQHEKKFKTKKDKEERVDSIERRASITGKSISSGLSSPWLSPKRAEKNLSLKSETLAFLPPSNTNQELVPVVEKESLETSSNSTEEEPYDISQADIEELFEDMPESE